MDSRTERLLKQFLGNNDPIPDRMERCLEIVTECCNRADAGPLQPQMLALMIGMCQVLDEEDEEVIEPSGRHFEEGQALEIHYQRKIRTGRFIKHDSKPKTLLVHIDGLGERLVRARQVKIITGPVPVPQEV